MLTKYLFPFYTCPTYIHLLKAPLVCRFEYFPHTGPYCRMSHFLLLRRHYIDPILLWSKKYMTGDTICTPISLNYLKKERKFSIIEKRRLHDIERSVKEDLYVHLCIHIWGQRRRRPPGRKRITRVFHLQTSCHKWDLSLPWSACLHTQQPWGKFNILKITYFYKYTFLYIFYII